MEVREEMSPEERGRLAWDRYYQVRSTVETEENIGKFITIDILSGDYEVGANNVETELTLQAHHDHFLTCTLRIGYRTAFSRGGRMVRLPQ